MESKLLIRYGGITVASLLLSNPIGDVFRRRSWFDRFGKVFPLIVLTFGLAVETATAQERAPLACVKEMDLPTYAGPIWGARISGTANVNIVLGSDGRAGSVDVESPHISMTNWLRIWCMRLRFLVECSGQRIHFTIIYRLEGDQRDVPDNKVVLKHPGTIVVTAHPPRVLTIID